MGKHAKCNASRGNMRRPSFVQHRIAAPSPMKLDEQTKFSQYYQQFIFFIFSWSPDKTNLRVLIDDDKDTSCVRNWPNCIKSKLSVGCGRSASFINTLDMVRGFFNGSPVTDVNL